MTAAEAADKVAKLRAVAASAAGTPEAETARTLADRLVAKFGLQDRTTYRTPEPPRERAAGYGRTAGSTGRPQGRQQGWGQDTVRPAGRTAGRTQGRPTVDGVRSTVGAYARRMF